MSIFLLEYINDSPYRQNVEVWVRSDKNDICEIIKEMRWLEDKEFQVSEAIPGKVGSTKCHYHHYKRDSIDFELLDNIQQNEVYKKEVAKLYICDGCDTYYMKRTECCGYNKKKMRKIVL